MNQGLQRSSFRNIWILSMVLIVGIAFFVYQQAIAQRDMIADSQMQLSDLNAELDNASRRAQALDKLDKLTIDERTATRLDILRHLGLEQTDYGFTVNTKIGRQIGDATLYLRNITLDVDLPYAQALELADKLYAMKKIVVGRMSLQVSQYTGDKVHLTLEGTIYGLEKNVAQ